MDRFTDKAGRIPSVGDRVRVRFPDWRPSYWGKLLAVSERSCRVANEATFGIHDVPRDFVFRARDVQQKAGREAMLQNSVLAAAIKPCKARRGR